VKGKDRQATLFSSLFFFSSPLTGPWKNALKTECILVGSPGAFVGHAWLNVAAMKGMSQGDSGVGRGIERGRLGFDVADVGRGGNERRGGVMPGIKRATTFLIEREFWV
jgi:hypothetical protein